jgi:hypothetical protein
VRGDAEDFASEGRLPLFDEAEGGPFAASKVTPEANERVAAAIIYGHRGRERALKLHVLMDILGLDERKTRGIVEQLVVTHRMRIGASEMGYYMIVDAEDLEAAIARPKAQIFAMWRRLRVLLEPHALRELHGQLGLGDE